VSTQEPDWFKQSFLDLGEDLAEARAAGKQGLTIVFHSEACAYCKAFVDVSLRDPEIAARVRRHFSALYLDLFADAPARLQRVPKPGGRIAKYLRGQQRQP